MTSTDHGKTWKRSSTNIGDVAASTPSLVLDSKTGLVSNYYYHRGAGVLRRRVVDPALVFDHPDRWPLSEPVATGSRVTFDAGNANATVIGDRHYVSFYSGKAPDTGVFVSEVAATGGAVMEAFQRPSSAKLRDFIRNANADWVRARFNRAPTFLQHAPPFHRPSSRFLQPGRRAVS